MEQIRKIGSIRCIRTEPLSLFGPRRVRAVSGLASIGAMHTVDVAETSTPCWERISRLMEVVPLRVLGADFGF